MHLISMLTLVLVVLLTIPANADSNLKNLHAVCKQQYGINSEFVRLSKNKFNQDIAVCKVYTCEVRYRFKQALI